MAIEPVEIKDTILKNFTPTITIAAQEGAGGVGSAGHVTGQGVIDYIGALNLSDLTDTAQARINIGLGNVDNTSDLNKPVSTATQTALNLKANANAVLLSINGDTTQNQTIVGGSGISISTTSGNTTVEIDFSVTQKGNVFNGGNQLVETDNFGKLIASVIPSTITANIIGNVSGSSASFTGNLNGDVTGQQTASVVSTVGGKTAAQVSSAVDSVLASTTLSTPNTLALRDPGGNCSFSTPTSALHAVTKAYSDKGFQQTVSSLPFSVTAPFVSYMSYILDPAFLSGGSFALPSAATVGAGFSIIAKSNNNGTMTIVPTGTDTIEYSVNLANSNAACVVSDGVSKWYVLYNGNIAGAVNVINGASSLGANVVQNTNLAQMPANRIKANLTGSPANASDVTISQIQSALNTGAFISNEILYGGNAGEIKGSTTFSFDGNSQVTLNAGASTNSSLTIGNSNALQLAYSGAANSFFQGTVLGDSAIRQSSLTNSLHIGVGNGTNFANMTMVNQKTDFNFPITLPQTQGGASVTGSVKTNFEYFEDQYSSFTTATTGAIIFVSFTIRYIRINRRVYMAFQDFNQNAVASSAIICTSAIPAKITPAITKHALTYGQRAGVRRGLDVQISNSGIVTIFGDDNGGNFQNGNIAAYFGQVFSYDV